MSFVGAIPASIPDSSEDLEIGGDTDTSDYLNAYIDEVRIYNRAFSADEIRAHYLRGAGAHGVALADKFRVLSTDNTVNFQIDGSGNAIFAGSATTTGSHIIGGTLTVQGSGTSTFAGPLQITSTASPQLSVRYDNSNKLDISVSSAGEVTLTGTATTTLATTTITKLTVSEVLKLTGLKKGELDLLAGCPPCQGFSSMRTKNGKVRISDPRNDLVFQYMRFVRELLPKAVMMENVPGLARDDRMEIILKELKELGYHIDENTVQVVNLADYGVPQRRRRMVLATTRNKKFILTFITNNTNFNFTN